MLECASGSEEIARTNQYRKFLLQSGIIIKRKLSHGDQYFLGIDFQSVNTVLIVLGRFELAILHVVFIDLPWRLMTQITDLIWTRKELLSRSFANFTIPNVNLRELNLYDVTHNCQVSDHFTGLKPT